MVWRRGGGTVVWRRGGGQWCEERRGGGPGVGGGGGGGESKTFSRSSVGGVCADVAAGSAATDSELRRRGRSKCKALSCTSGKRGWDAAAVVGQVESPGPVA